MDTPGFDPVSATGQIAGGANMIASPPDAARCFGAKPVPSIKLATNTPMYQRLEEDMDINCGDDPRRHGHAAGDGPGRSSS